MTGTYLDGSIVFDKPLAMANGEHLSLVVEDPDRCADGNKWPTTKAEVEAWCGRIEALPTLFDTAGEAQAFKARMQEMRKERSSTPSRRTE